MYSVSETTGVLTLIKSLDFESAAVILFHAQVTDLNADASFPNQTDSGTDFVKIDAKLIFSLDSLKY